jgi:hypothetical protein
MSSVPIREPAAPEPSSRCKRSLPTSVPQPCRFIHPPIHLVKFYAEADVRPAEWCQWRNHENHQWLYVGRSCVRIRFVG